MRALKVLCFAFLSLIISAHATESNQVPTDQLIANLSILAQPAGEALGIVELMSASVKDGKLTQDAVSLSSDESFEFSVNGQTVAYDPNRDTLLPLAVGSIYDIHFKRASGENFHSSVRLPAAAPFLAPANGSVFDPSLEVVVQWEQPKADAQMIILSVDCGEEPIFKVNDQFTELRFQSGWAAKCKLPFAVRVQKYDYNGGQGFGEVLAANGNEVGFSYGAPAYRARPAFTSDQIAKIRAAFKRGQRVLRL